MENAPNVLALFAAPDRNSSLRAVSIALLRIRATGVSCEAIGKALGCSADTVENASNEKSLLSFDSVARLGYFFPDEFKVIEELWSHRPAAAPTVSDRVERIERELNAIRREVAA